MQCYLICKMMLSFVVLCHIILCWVQFSHLLALDIETACVIKQKLILEMYVMNLTFVAKGMLNVNSLIRQLRIPTRWTLSCEWSWPIGPDSGPAGA